MACGVPAAAQLVRAVTHLRAAPLGAATVGWTGPSCWSAAWAPSTVWIALALRLLVALGLLLLGPSRWEAHVLCYFKGIRVLRRCPKTATNSPSWLWTSGSWSWMPLRRRGIEGWPGLRSARCFCACRIHFQLLHYRYCCARLFGTCEHSHRRWKKCPGKHVELQANVPCTQTG